MCPTGSRANLRVIMNPPFLLDESLLDRRPVKTCVPDDGGNGYDVILSCGHLLWMATRPPEETYCGQCLDILIRQIRGVQAHQEPRW